MWRPGFRKGKPVWRARTVHNLYTNYCLALVLLLLSFICLVCFCFSWFCFCFIVLWGVCVRVCVCVPVRFVCFLYFVLSFGFFLGGVCCLFWGFVWLFVFVLLGGGFQECVCVLCCFGSGFGGGSICWRFCVYCCCCCCWLGCCFSRGFVVGCSFFVVCFCFCFLFFFFFCCIYRKIAFFTS